MTSQPIRRGRLQLEEAADGLLAAAFLVLDPTDNQRQTAAADGQGLTAPPPPPAPAPPP
jgi:hypothetical protein